MKAEITAGSPDELIVSLDATDLPGGASVTDQSLKAGLPGAAPGIAAGILDMVGQPPEAGDPRRVSVVTVRVTRTVVLGEVTFPVDAVDVWT